MGSFQISFSDKLLFYDFVRHGFPIGRKGTELGFHDTLDEKTVKEIVFGYFATDGCLVIANNNGTKYPRIEFSSISKRLLSQVQLFLLKQGMRGGIYVSHLYANGNNPLYRLQYNGQKNLEIFRNEVGFMNPKHENKYQKYRMAVGRFEPPTSTL